MGSTDESFSNTGGTRWACSHRAVLAWPQSLWFFQARGLVAVGQRLAPLSEARTPSSPGRELSRIVFRCGDVFPGVTVGKWPSGSPLGVACVALCCFQQEDVQVLGIKYRVKSRCDFGPPGVSTHHPSECAVGARSARLREATRRREMLNLPVVHAAPVHVERRRPLVEWQSW